MLFRKLSAVAILALAAGCSSGKTSDIAALTGDPAAGGDLFDANCVSCHGADGGGGSGPDLLVASNSVEEVIDLVYNGEDEMPAFSGSMSDQDIADVSAFVVQDLQGG